LVFDQSKDRTGEFSLFLLDGDEEIVFPLNEGELENITKTLMGFEQQLVQQYKVN